MNWPAKAEEFTNFVNQSIASESGLRHITVKDLHRWHETGFFAHPPEYYRFDLQIVLALLKLEAYWRQQPTSQLTQTAQAPETGELEVAFQKSITQVVSCVASSLIEEQLIIQGLKDTNLIGSAGQIAVNFYPFSDKPIDIPPTGAEAKTTNALIIEIEDSGKLESGSATPLGKKEFTPDDKWFKTLSSLDPESVPQQKWWSGRSLFSLPIFMPVMAIKGTPATIVDSVYITANGQRIPPIPSEKPFPSRLYPAFLNTDGSSIQKIVDFIINYGLTLWFKSSNGDWQRNFCAEQQKMRELLAEARNGNLGFQNIQQLSPPHENALVEQDFIEALLLVPYHADYISEVRRACSPEEQKSKFLPVRRYYSWFDYMWTEVLEDIGQRFIPPLCKSCGKILPPPSTHKRGRKRRYCPDCKRVRGKERTQHWRQLKQNRSRGVTEM